MIVQLSQTVCQQLQEVHQLETRKSHAESIKATLDVLITVRDAVNELVTLIALLHHRLPDQLIQTTTSTLDTLAGEVKTSGEHFEGEPRQTKTLSSIQSRIQKLMKEVKIQWKAYARGRTQEPFDLLNLVRHLPEVEAQQTVYEELKGRLEWYIDNPPLTTEQLTDFDQKVYLFVERLNSIEGLNGEVKLFLQRTLQGEATLADLTDEALRWCRQGDRAKVFTIRFTR